MKAVCIVRREGEKSKFEYGELPGRPGLRQGETLVRVKTCALNHLDLLLLDKYARPISRHISGSDVCGVIEEVKGEGRLKPGQEVIINPSIPCGECGECLAGRDCEMVKIFGYNTPGGFAEYVSVPTTQVYPKPVNLSDEEAAAFPLTFLTAWHMLVGRARLQKGEAVFVWGATGGLGMAAVQIAKYLGAKVIAAAKNKQQAQRLRELGADAVVDYAKGNVIEAVQAANDGKKVDVVFESIGAATWADSLAMLRVRGRVVIAGTTIGEIASQDLSDVYVNQHTILGSRMGSAQEFEQVLALVSSGKLKPVVDKVFPLADFAQAAEYIKNRQQTGKAVVRVD